MRSGVCTFRPSEHEFCFNARRSEFWSYRETSGVYQHLEHGKYFITYSFGAFLFRRLLSELLQSDHTMVAEVIQRIFHEKLPLMNRGSISPLPVRHTVV